MGGGPNLAGYIARVSAVALKGMPASTLRMACCRDVPRTCMAGPWQGKAASLLEKLTRNVIRNMFDNFKQTGWLWEQYHPETGIGQRTHPFNGWSSLVTLIVAESL